MTKRIFRVGSLVVVFALAVSLGVETAWAENPKDVLYVIGDSLSDPGNLYALTKGLWPPADLYPEGTFSNGPVWVEYFADQLGVNLDDRAYGGAFTGMIELLDGRTNERREFFNYDSYEYWGYGLPPDLPGVPQEVEGLLNDHPNGLNPNALYIVWAGANDFFAALETGRLDILAAAVQNITSTDEDALGIICRLGHAGAKHFAVANLPDIGLTPFGQSNGMASMISKLAAQFNQALEAALAALPPDCAQTLVVLDAFQILQEVISNRQAYGLVDVDTPCQALGSGADCSQYLFWDTVHPTTYGHALFAERFRAAFCGTGDQHPGLRGRPHGQPPPIWRGVCYGSK